MVKGLYAKGFGRKDVIQLFVFIDWVMALPEALERSFEQEITEYEKERNVEYVTSIERIGMQKGMQKGLAEAVLDVLEVRFGPAASGLQPDVERIGDRETLRVLHRRALMVQTLEEFRAALPETEDRRPVIQAENL